MLIYFLLDGHLPFQASVEMRTLSLECPPHFSDAARDLVQQLLQPDVSLRLGASCEDHLKIKAHAFFQVQRLGDGLLLYTCTVWVMHGCMSLNMRKCCCRT